MKLFEAIELIGNDQVVGGEPALWADLGCGSGLFTEALASLLPTGSTIYAVDKVQIDFQKQSIPAHIQIQTLRLDFEQERFPVAGMDGFLMANSLHYVADKPRLIQSLAQQLKPGGRFLIVEYDTDIPVPTWVPYPCSFQTLSNLFKTEGFSSVQRLAGRPSLFRRAELYAALVSR